jgi:mono/diheme cytochrome c family protein
MTILKNARVVLAAGVMVSGLSLAASNGWTAASPADPQGSALYRTYCASCHGVSGRGDGPAAGDLRRQPSDLAQFARRNGGTFPTAKLQRIVDGRDVRAHGSSEMPVWGDAFKRSEGGLSEEAVAARIAAIVRYLELMQERTGH